VSEHVILTEYVTYKGKRKKVSELSPTSGYKVEVRCPVCGKDREVFYRSIAKAGHCICQKCIVKQNHRKYLEVGSKYGRLTVVSHSARSGYSLFRCDCGNMKEIGNYYATSGHTRSCGCVRIENIKSVSYNPDGEDHWNWKGGISSERHLAMSKKEYSEWREAVFERDNYTCQKCGQVGYKLNAHHIEPYAGNEEERLNIDNGITFCNKCHRKYHNIYGYKATGKEIEEYRRS
jgi:hypothetical protein